MDDLTADDELYTIVCQGDLTNELNARLQILPDVDNNLQFLYQDDLTNELYARLQILPDINKTLQFLYQRDNQQLNLLMLAALHGHDKVIRILLSYSSNAEKLVELTGSVNDIDGNLVTDATALWCACDRGHYTVARILIEKGNANVSHDLRNPLLIDAVIHARLDTIQFLIENDYVDINKTRERNRPNYNSLMLSAALGLTKIVAYLLEKGAKIDYSSRMYHETALGCAAMRGHLCTVQLLCSAGASTNINNITGETPLVLAFNNNHIHVVDYFMDHIGNELCIEELELNACSLIVSRESTDNDQSWYIEMVDLMRRIFQIRKARNCLKTIMKPVAAYNFQQECQTIEEFEKIQHDNNRLYIEALIIRERILMPKKIAALCEPLHDYGDKLVERGDFEACLHLWEHTFHLYQTMGHETRLHRLVWTFCRMLTANILISPQLFVQICRLTLQPSEKNKKNDFIENALCLVTIAAKVLEQSTLTKIERQSMYQWINDLCRQQWTTSNGQTLLHLSVNDQTYRDINYRASEIKQVLHFPNLAGTQLLLTYGSRWINVDAFDISNGNTALHIIAQSTHIDALPIVKLLINAGAHADCLNKYNKTPFDYAKTAKIKAILQEQQTPSLLKCLCARYIVTQQLNYEVIWPGETKLNTFIHLHGCIGKQSDLSGIFH